MIINLRGTSGAGKSHLVRHIMQFYTEKEEIFIEGRKQPLYYILSNGKGTTPLAVLGHYNTACGGCDTINKVDTSFELARKLHDEGNNVLFEGVLMGYEWKRTITLPDLRVVFLDTSIETCLASINDRRRARGKMEPVNPENTIAKDRSCRNTEVKLQDLDVTTFRLSRADAATMVEEMLGL